MSISLTNTTPSAQPPRTIEMGERLHVNPYHEGSSERALREELGNRPAPVTAPEAQLASRRVSIGSHLVATGLLTVGAGSAALTALTLAQSHDQNKDFSYGNAVGLTGGLVIGALANAAAATILLKRD